MRHDGPSGSGGSKLDAHGGIESGDPDRDWLIHRLRSMGAYCDHDGRPLEEGRVPEHQRRSGVPFELRLCPYAGARAAAQPERPMNISAMKRVLSTLPEAIGTFLALRQRFFTRASGKRKSFIDLWRLGQLTMALPGSGMARGSSGAGW